VTELEKRAVTALRSVKMPERTWHGRGAEALNLRMTLQPQLRLGFTEAADLWFLVWRYRRQIADREVVAHANEIVNGEMDLAF
jgi:hypothetical protein